MAAKKFKAKIKHLNLISQKGNSKCYGGYLDISFVNHTNKENLFDNNVRLQSFDDAKGIKTLKREKPIIGAILETLEKIHKGKDASIMFEMNQGGAMMCESIEEIFSAGKGTGEYEITFSNRFHGIGNGQQTIRTAYYAKNNGIEIKEGTLLFFKFLVGYSEKENNDICVSNNKHNAVKTMDIVSNSWSDLASDLYNLGINLVYKKDAIRETLVDGMKTIDIYDNGFYGAISSYVSENIWEGKEKIFDAKYIENIDAQTMMHINDIHESYNDWYVRNQMDVEARFKQIMDKDHKSTKNELRKIFIAASKNMHQANEPIEEFFDMCYDSLDECVGEKYQTGQSLKNFYKNTFLTKLENKKLRKKVEEMEMSQA